MGVFKELQDRGLINQVTDESLAKRLDTESFPHYIGFDATASSLHIGSLATLLTMRRMQDAGHKPIVLVGGGTTMVGDPSGKTEMRKMLDKTDIAENARKFHKQMSKFIKLGDGPSDGVIVNNAEWLMDLNYIEFLRDIGKHFSVNRMLTAESVKLRLEKGLSFLEFNYQLLQAYDFLHLFQTMDCRLQMGGSDQWGNIVAGVELIRRVCGKEAYGITFPLITKSDGQKMGKSEAGAIWLDPELTSPYEYYQYWVNVEDNDVIRFLNYFTFLPLDEISKLAELQGEELREAKRVLAYEVTKLTHGEEEAQKAEKAAQAAFSGGNEIDPNADIPTVEIKAEDLKEAIPLAKLMASTGIASSGKEAKRLAMGGGVTVNGDKAEGPQHPISLELADAHGQIILRIGKKRYHRIRVID